ncbi:MAG: nitrite/sulfite reductase [Dehalococcoidia bacterium]|nr:nitrite/sulfite reductase [Dehalococcoidia bacterium]
MTQPGTGKKGVLPVLEEEIDGFEKEVGRFLQGEWDPDAFTRFRLKQGVYGQRQPDTLMIRVKIPVGGLTAGQLEALGVIARDFAPLKKGHVTTRENMQLHFIPLDRTPDALRVLGEVGLSTREACGNTVRNVTGCPLAGVCAEEPFDVTPYAGAYARYFLRHPVTQAMPRKIKTSFSGCEKDCAITAIHDLGFTPRLQEINGEMKRGFKMVVGGGLSIMPRMAPTLYEFVPVEEYLRVSEAVLRVFDASSELRKDRMKARIKFLVHRIGIDEFRKLVEAELEQPWAKNPMDPTPLLYVDDEEADAPQPLAPGSYASPKGEGAEFEVWRAANVLPQKQAGYRVVLVKLSRGDIQEHQFPLLAQIARKHAGGRARFTQQQNLAFRWVREESLYQVWRELEAAGLAEAGAASITDVTSCPGTDSCKLGITSSMGLAKALQQELADMDITDPLVKGLHIKVSGCPNACGQHHIANIGFHGAAMKGDRGNQVPAYEMFVGGSYPDINGQTETRIGLRLKGKVPAKRAPEVVRRVLGYYQGHRLEAEPFNAFVDRVGTEPFEVITGELREVGPLNRENIGTYMDWGKTVLYKLERGEGECAV